MVVAKTIFSIGKHHSSDDMRIFMQFTCCTIEINGNLKQKTIIVKNTEILENKNALSKSCRGYLGKIS
ncbi:hypothetical protein H5410_064431 [Solanum commersonii]|uniref:Uncharacterized protein n=1 Tax=Solanum commersonii TaxID=4109 RepID=A0A9J5VZF3_SOLCO|nr:hypothetical protein H5410_064431 [Solanum commersonii]